MYYFKVGHWFLVYGVILSKCSGEVELCFWSMLMMDRDRLPELPIVVSKRKSCS